MNDDRNQVKAVLRKIVREEISDSDIVDARDVTEKVIERLRGNTVLLDRVLSVFLYRVIYDDVIHAIRDGRGSATNPTADVVELPNGVVTTRGAITNEARRLAARWWNWMETTGEYYVRLVKMSRDDLRAAAAIRSRRAQTDAGIAAWLTALAGRVGEHQTVEDVYTVEEIAELFERHCRTIDPDMAFETDEAAD